MRFLFLTTLLLAGAAQAEEMAVEYLAKCTGPAFDRQVQGRLSGMPCFQHENCDTSDIEPASYAAEVLCFTSALSLCQVEVDPNACLQTTAGWIASQTDQMAEAYPGTRVEAAAEYISRVEKANALLDRADQLDMFAILQSCLKKPDVDGLAVVDMAPVSMCTAVAAFRVYQVHREIARLVAMSDATP